MQIHNFEAGLPVAQIAEKEASPPTFRAVFICLLQFFEIEPEVVVLADIPVSSHKTVDSNPAIGSTEVCYVLLFCQI